MLQNTLLRRVVPKAQSTAVVGKGREETLHKPEGFGCLSNLNKNPQDPNFKYLGFCKRKKTTCLSNQTTSALFWSRAQPLDFLIGQFSQYQLGHKGSAAAGFRTSITYIKLLLACPHLLPFSSQWASLRSGCPYTLPSVMATDQCSQKAYMKTV